MKMFPLPAQAGADCADISRMSGRVVDGRGNGMVRLLHCARYDLLGLFTDKKTQERHC
ncbi:MAG: hypothetical protein ACKVPJ_00870 [Chitinophagales bacterium]